MAAVWSGWALLLSRRAPIGVACREDANSQQTRSPPTSKFHLWTNYTQMRQETQARLWDTPGHKRPACFLAKAAVTLLYPHPTYRGRIFMLSWCLEDACLSKAKLRKLGNCECSEDQFDTFLVSPCDCPVDYAFAWEEYTAEWYPQPPKSEDASYICWLCKNSVPHFLTEILRDGFIVYDATFCSEMLSGHFSCHPS